MDKILVGNAPYVIGEFDLECPEMMFVQDMPIIMPGTDLRLPSHLEFIRPLVGAIQYSTKTDYVYVSCKSMFTTFESRGRPGWHLDGFGTDDINYVWSDDFPTEFYNQQIEITNDPVISRLDMELMIDESKITTYPNKILLEMNNTCIHRVSVEKREGFRTFIKLTVSKNQFKLKGNAHNYLFNYNWDMTPRTLDRNQPSK